jgi:hypothetical protein
MSFRQTPPENTCTWSAAAKLPPWNALCKGGSCRYRTPRCLRHRHFHRSKERRFGPSFRARPPVPFEPQPGAPSSEIGHCSESAPHSLTPSPLPLLTGEGEGSGGEGSHRSSSCTVVSREIMEPSLGITPACVGRRQSGSGRVSVTRRIPVRLFISVSGEQSRDTARSWVEPRRKPSGDGYVRATPLRSELGYNG